MKKFSLKEYLHYNLVIMNYLGLWPKKDYTSKWYLAYSVIVNGFFNFVLTLGIAGYVVTSRNLLEDAIGAGYVLMFVMDAAKSFFVIKYNKMFKFLVDSEIHKSAKVELNEDQNKILCDYVGLWKRVHTFYSSMSVVIAVNYIASPVVSKAPHPLPFKYFYPFNYDNSIVYIAVYLHQSVGAVVGVYMNMNGATLAAGFLAYIAAQCEVLVDLLKNLNNENAKNGERVKICVEYHKKIVQYAQHVESYFSNYLLIQFTCSCVSTALIMASLSMNHDFWFIGFLQLGVWADLYIYCWYGNEVTEKSKKIPYAAFEANWVDASEDFKKDLLFFMLRTQKPIKIYAVNFFELSLDTFISILRTAYSYFMLLSQLSTD